MNQNLTEMLKVSEGRHLRAEELQLFQSYYDGLPHRLESMKQLEAKESACVKGALDDFFGQYPGMNNQSDTYEKAVRDMTYLYRTAAMGMVQHDFLEVAQKAGFVFDIFASLGFPKGAMDSAYDSLRSSMKRELSAEAWRAAQPFYQMLSESRMAAWAELNLKKKQLIAAGVAFVLEKWPQLKSLPEVELHLAKDMSTLLQAVGLSMLSQDPCAVNERKAWLYSYFKTLRFEMKMVYETYEQLPQLAQGILSASSLSLLNPWIKLLQTD